MIMVKVDTTTKYHFTNEIEEKIENYADENSFSIEDAIYDLIGQGELDLELDSVYEDVDNTQIIQVEKFE